MRFLSVQFAPGLLKFLAGFAAVAAAFLWLLHPYAMFNSDMENVYWMMAYEAVSLKSSGSLTLIYHVPHLFGLPYPLFYAWGYVAVNGALVTLIGPAVISRLMLLGALSLQFFSTLRLGTRFGLPWGAAYVLSCILAWSIYSLTNLYTRSSVMEYFATCCLISSLCCLLTVIVEGPSRANRYEQAAWGFYFVFVSGSHPITLYFGGFTLAACGVLGLAFSPARVALLKNLVLVSLAWFVTLIPWLYLMEKFVDKLAVSDWAGMASYYSWTYTDPQSWNIFLNSFRPFARSVWPSDIKPSGFDTQIAAALVIYLLGYAAVRLFLPRREITLRGNPWLLNGLALLGLVSALVYFLANCFHELYPYMVRLFARMQFSYRGVTYVNIWLFVAVIALLARTEFTGARARRWMQVAGLLAFLFAGAGLVTKLNDALMCRSFQDHDDFSWITLKNVHVTSGPVSLYGPKDYAITADVPEYALKDNPAAVFVPFTPLPEPHLDDLSPQEIDLTQRTLIVTHILSFPWNKVYANDVEIPHADRGFAVKEIDQIPIPVLVFWLGPGHYRLTYAFTPEPVYIILRYISLAAFLTWLFFFGRAVLRTARPGLRESWAWGTALLPPDKGPESIRYHLCGCLGLFGLRFSP